MNGNRTIGLIVAAGRGERAGGGMPKQYRTLGGKALLAHAFDALASHPSIDRVAVVIGAGQEDFLAEALAEREPLAVCQGGATRRESVLAGLEAIAAEGGAFHVLIHDAARPFIPPAVIDRVLSKLDAYEGVVPGLPVSDTLIYFDNIIGESVPRQNLYRIQTPQAFLFDVALKAHRRWPEEMDVTDDAQLVRDSGYEVCIVPGDNLLEKVTRPEDFAAVEARLAARMSVRTGMGFDVHRLATGEKLWLGGILIPHDQGLVGHSDADVGLHALTDAILGAIGDGDIGTHFPPSDPKWRGASSDRFLAHAASLVEARGGRIEHVDLTLICEAPKIGPYRDRIRTRIAGLLRLPERRISIKATTTERLGFTGRGEGIAAQAIATVRIPEEM